MSSTAPKKRRLARFITIGAVLSSLGLGALQASSASAASAVVATAPATAMPSSSPAAGALTTSEAPARAIPAQAAGVAPSVWWLSGVFPDPLTCHLSGIATGRSYYCGFYVFFWGLNIWY